MKNILKAFFKISLSVLAIYFVFTKIEVKDVVEVFRNANLLLLTVALLFFAFSKLLSAWRLNYFFDAADIKLESNSNIRLYLIGMYYNLFLPGGIGGDGYKIYVLNKKFGTKVKHLFWSVMLDRINGVLILAILAFLLIPLLKIDTRLTILSLSLVPVSIGIYMLINKIYFKRFYSAVIPTSLLSFGVQVSQMVCAYIILMAYGMHDNTIAYLVLFLVSSIVAVLPFTIGGIGSREITFLFGAQYLNLDPALSVALSLIFYIITAVVSLSGIYYSLFPTRLNLKTDTQIQNHQDITV